jgi:tripartite-type tricarboxylate transporter receptor subunit TctC
MKVSRRRVLQLATGASASSILSPAAWAQAYPARPVHTVSGFPPGGINDTYARLIGQWLSERLGQ